MRYLRFLTAGIGLMALQLAATSVASAQDFSYVYIQGDKQTPIYVKVEGEMLPRYGKNYALIGRLAPGPLHLDILFQQNVHPPLHFTIMVPENGRRAFMVHQKGDAFSLYDLQQNFSLQPDNDISDDHIPAQISNATLQATDYTAHNTTPPPATTPTQEAEPVAKVTMKAPDTAPETPQEATQTIPVAATPVQTTAEKTTEAKQETATSAPVFIGGIELNSGRNGDNSASNSGTTADNSDSSVPGAAIINSDCKSPVSDTKFVQLFASMKARKNEDERLGLFLQACKQYCFSTDMIAQLAQTMETDPARFSVAKNGYAKTTDQEKYPGLESLFSTEDWKAEFKDFLHH